MGAWIVRHHEDLFDTDPWTLFEAMIDGHKYIVGWVILAGGACGLAGLVFRVRALSIASCVIGIGWCSWLAAYQWFAPVNVGAGFAILGCSVFVHRFLLLIAVPKPGHEIAYGR
jgi:hypothetical protein